MRLHVIQHLPRVRHPVAERRVHVQVRLPSLLSRHRLRTALLAPSLVFSASGPIFPLACFLFLISRFPSPSSLPLSPTLSTTAHCPGSARRRFSKRSRNFSVPALTSCSMSPVFSSSSGSSQYASSMYPLRVVNDGITIAPVRSATSIGPVGIDASAPMNGTTILGPSMSRSAISTTTPPCFSVRITRFTFPTLTGANVCPLLDLMPSSRRDRRGGWRGSVSANTLTPHGISPCPTSSGFPKCVLIIMTPFPD